MAATGHANIVVSIATAAMAAGGVGVTSVLFGRELADDRAFLATQLAGVKGP